MDFCKIFWSYCEFAPFHEFLQGFCGSCDVLRVSANFYEFLPVSADFCGELRFFQCFSDFLRLSEFFPTFDQFLLHSTSFFGFLRVFVGLCQFLQISDILGSFSEFSDFRLVTPLFEFFGFLQDFANNCDFGTLFECFCRFLAVSASFHRFLPITAIVDGFCEVHPVGFDGFSSAFCKVSYVSTHSCNFLMVSAGVCGVFSDCIGSSSYMLLCKKSNTTTVKRKAKLSSVWKRSQGPLHY